MSMPRQLQMGLLRRRQYPRREPRPIAETLPALDVNELLHAIPHKHGTVRTQSFTSPSHPPIIGLRLTCQDIEVAHSAGHIQTFRLKWIRTGFGHPRPAVLCDKCQRPVLKLYNRYNSLACRHCCNAVHASQVCHSRARPALQLKRLRTFLQLKSYMRRTNRHRLEARCRSLEANAQLRYKVSNRLNDKALRPSGNYGMRGAMPWR